MKENNVTKIKIDDILPNRLQPRIVFQDEQIDELADSIKKYGVINPITVRKLGDKYEIIAGERRYKASKSIGLEEIPAFVIEADDKASAELALIENIQRKDLSPIEEGLSYDKILKISDITQEELSKRLGKKQSTIANKIRLLKLDDSVKDALLNERISERHARSLLKLTEKEEQKKLLERIIENRLTVRQTDQEIEKIIEQKGEIIVMNKEFELPNSTLIEDKTDEQIKEPTVNPSFVNLDKIENESKDIFVEKPQVNIDDLLKVVPQKEENILESVEPVVEEKPQETEVLKPKFFNFFPEEPLPEASNESSIQAIENIEQEPIQENEIPSSTMFNFAETIPNEVVTPEEPKEENTIEQIEQKENIDFESFEVPAFTQFENNPQIEVEADKEEQELPEMKESKIEEEIKYTPDNFNPIIHNDFVEAPIEEELELFEEEEIPQQEVNESAPKQMKDVIRVIRDCNDIIESYGFKIEAEEFDLETMYQVIFKIYKN